MAASTTMIAAQTVLINATTSTLNNSSAYSFTTKDVVLFPLRMISRVDKFLFNTVPRTLIQATGIGPLAQRVVSSFANTEAAAVGAEVVMDAANVAPGASWTDLFFETLQAGTNRSYWGMLHYVTSRWAFTCFALALILNRVTVYGSTRNRINLTWNKRFALRFIPIMLLLSQMHRLLQAIHCQSSPDFSLYRHGDNNKYSVLDWSTEGGPLHTVTSNILFWSTDEQSCAALSMSRPEPDVRASTGSFSLLWPTFLKLGLSHLVENLSCSLQQIPVMTEIGLSVFEHSLAFAEAETMIAHTLTSRIKKVTNSTSTTSTASASSMPTSDGSIPASGTILAITDAIQSFVEPHPFDRVNVPIEVLLVALISVGNCLTSHIISILNKKNKWRLANTAFWGICYMSAFSWGFFRDSEMIRTDTGYPKPVSGLLHFPTVAIVGFLPHMMIIVGIFVCGMIYAVALLFTAISLGTNPSIARPTSLKERISIAHDNLQAAIQLRSVSIRYYEDFYTALLRIGFAALTAASEAVFLNEGRAVEMRQFTWVEEDRLDELDSRSLRTDEVTFQIVEEYGIPGTSFEHGSKQSQPWKSGYEKERKLEAKEKVLKQQDGSFIYPNPRTDGVGALQRTTRFYLLFIFMRGIFFTVGGWFAYGSGALLDRVGITSRPDWLRRVIGSSMKQVADDREKAKNLQENQRFDQWAAVGGITSKSRQADVDIEHEIRSRIASQNPDNPQEAVDEEMYQWWKNGGWYGHLDESGDYAPPFPSIEQDDDATSVITTTTSASGTDQEWESEPEGARTPTQRYASPAWSFSGLRQRRSETPTPEAPLLDNLALARLLNPQDQAARDEARILASHLETDSRIMTRSQYQKKSQLDRAKVLLAGRVPLGMNDQLPAAGPLSGDEESQVLEQLLIKRRIQKQSKRQFNAQQTSTDAQRETISAGPLCVVCQSESRTIIAWPCRCLTVCEDCRVNLAMNNFGNCVTCRRAVGGFVRLYVP